MKRQITLRDWVSRKRRTAKDKSRRRRKGKEDILNHIFDGKFPILLISLYRLSSSMQPEIGDVRPVHQLEHQAQPFPAHDFRAAFKGNNIDCWFGDSLGFLHMNMIISSRTNSVLLELSS